jgi:tRNA(fMet)-specific endonuclease VapC
MNQAVVVVDTNVISYIFNQHSLGTLYKTRLKGQTLFLAAQTIEEIRFGAFIANWGENRLEKLEGFLGSFKVVQTTDSICTCSAQIRVEAKQKGFVLEPADAWIAATALVLGVPLVTHNKKHFDFLNGLTLITENAV